MSKKILVTGGHGFLGRSLLRCLQYYSFEPKDIYAPTSKDYDLTREEDVKVLYHTYKPDIVIHLAARVGGIDSIMKNSGKFFYDNSLMGLYLIEYARMFEVKQFIYLSSGCSYPKYCNVPFSEEDLWSGFPDESVASYAVAKKALIVLLDSYKKQYNFNSCVLIPSNLYGPNDHFNSIGSHVVPSIISKVYQAIINNQSEIICWGTGEATRDFLYCDDASLAIIAAIEKEIKEPNPINIAGGVEVSMKTLVQYICSIFGYQGKIIWDPYKPEGQPRRCMNIDKAYRLLNWKPKTKLSDGLISTINWFKENII